MPYILLFMLAGDLVGIDWFDRRMTIAWLGIVYGLPVRYQTVQGLE